MSQNRREEENGQKETERRRMVEVTRLNRKENQTEASCESNLSFLLLKHGQRRAAGKWRRESRPNPPPDERGGRIRTSTSTAPALMNPSLEQDLDFKSLGLEKGRASKGKRKHPSLFLKKAAPRKSWAESPALCSTAVRTPPAEGGASAHPSKPAAKEGASNDGEEKGPKLPRRKEGRFTPPRKT